MIYRIFGRNGHGKTHYIYSKLSECIMNKKSAFLVVPEQGAVKTENDVIEVLGNSSNMYVEVINFKRLCNRVFRDTGGLVTSHIQKGADSIIMSYALQEISDFLLRYRDSALTADFAKKALESINELSHASITEKQLTECVETLSKSEENKEICAKLSDLLLILQAYGNMKEELTGEKLDIYDKLCEKLEESGFFTGKTVIFDGFYSFTAKELKIISLIAEDAQDIYITFPCDMGEKDPVFSRCISSYESIEKISERTGVELCDVSLKENMRHESHSALYQYTCNFSSNALCCDTTKEDKSKSGLQVISCRDIYAEARCAASTVFDLIKNGARYSDICICAKNSKDYEGILDATFKKCGFPLNLDHPEKLSDCALYGLIYSAFEAVGVGKKDAAMSYIKSGLSGLCDTESDLLETYMKTWELHTDSILHDNPWAMNPQGYTDAKADEELLQTINNARKKVFVCLDGFGFALKNAKTLKDYSSAVWTLLCDIAKVSGKQEFDDRADGIYLDLVCSCLDTLVATAGHKNISSPMFLQLFKAISEQCDTGKIPERLDCVMFSPIDLVRASNVKYIILLGANDGIFPSNIPSTGLFNERERPVLYNNGIKLSEPGENAAFDDLFLAYSAISSAKECAYILYSKQNIKSEKLFMSIIVQSAIAITGVTVQDFDERDFENAYCSDDLLLEDCLISQSSPQRAAAEQYLHQKPGFDQKLQQLFAKYTEQSTLSPDVANSLYGDSLTTSYSRLEKFNQCPFSHFCTYTLRLRPEPKAELDAMNAGTIIHKILEQLVPLAQSAKNSNTPIDTKKTVDNLLEKYLDVIASGCRDNLPKRFEHLYKRLSRILYAAANAIIEEIKVSSFQMKEFELNVSKNKGLSPCPIPLQNGATLYISGQIDRVDIYEKDGVSYIRIVDYKTGSKSFKTQDVLSGFNLQMLLYMYSVCNSDTKMFGDKVIPAGIMYSRITDPDSKQTLGYDDAELIISMQPKAHSDGRFLHDEEILKAMDTTMSGMYIPVTYQDGIVQSSDYLLSLESMGKLINFSAQAAADLANEIYKGAKDIRPYIDKNLDSCAYCDMLFVCQGHKKERYMSDTSLLEKEILGE